MTMSSAVSVSDQCTAPAVSSVGATANGPAGRLGRSSTWNLEDGLSSDLAHIHTKAGQYIRATCLVGRRGEHFPARPAARRARTTFTASERHATATRVVDGGAKARFLRKACVLTVRMPVDADAAAGELV